MHFAALCMLQISMSADLTMSGILVVQEGC